MFDHDNPEWQKRGVLVQTTDKKGVTKLTTRMSFQTRQAMADAMLERTPVVAAAPADPALKPVFAVELSG